MLYGITSFTHIIKLLFSSYNRIFTLYIISVLTALSTLIEGFIYESANAVYFLAILYLLDFLTGIWKAIKTKSINSKTFPRAGIMLFIACLLLFISFNAAKHSIIFSFLPGALYAVFVGQQIISIVENLFALGYVHPEIMQFITKKFSIKNLLNENEPTSDTDN